MNKSKDLQPTRVVVDAEAYGVQPKVAASQYNITSDIIFLRGDGWSLGAPTEFESVAWGLWKDSWEYFAYVGDTEWRPIDEYRG